MKVLFEIDTDFVNYPMKPPTLENCKKCAFYGSMFSIHCVRLTHQKCDCGQNGYFILNNFKEVSDENRKTELPEV